MSEQTEIKIDLTEGFQNLSKAPIVEAAIDVRARAEAPWQEGPVSQQLKGQLPDYPKVVSQKEIQQQFPAQRPQMKNLKNRYKDNAKRRG